MKGVIWLAMGLVLSGCSPALEQCRRWRDDGYMYSTMDSCSQCLESFGPNNRDAVVGCAVGLDAGKFIEATTPG